MKLCKLDPVKKYFTVKYLKDMMVILSVIFPVWQLAACSSVVANAMDSWTPSNFYLGSSTYGG